MLSKRKVHRKGKIYYNATDSFSDYDYVIVERNYEGNTWISPYTYWVAYYGHNGAFMRQGNISAQFLHDEIEKDHAKKLMKKL